MAILLIDEVELKEWHQLFRGDRIGKSWFDDVDKFDEEKHPRDERGQFAETEGSGEQGGGGKKLNGLGPSWRNSLSPREKKSIRTFINTPNYRGINDVLRGKVNVPLERSTFKGEVKAIDSALARAELPEDVTVYRGGRIDVDVGGEFVDKGFVATTTSKDDAQFFRTFQGGVLMKIALPKGTRAAHVGKLSKHEADRDQILLARGTKFRLDRITNGGPRKTYHLSVVT